MADFPTSLFTARATENLPGIVYDPTKKQNLFSEDFQNLGAEISAIEICLGLSPKWASASVAERIKGIRSLSDANEAVITIKGANVGIGTTAPGQKLDVKGYAVIGDGTTAEQGVHINALTYPTIRWQVGGTNKWAAFVNNAGTDALSFYAYGAGAGDKMVLLQNGNVGIGDAAPGAKLSVVGNATIGYASAQTAPANGLIIQGNVGIGTTSPSAKMDILSDILRLRTAKTPATAGAAGNAGDICWDSSYLYVCVATNSWVRSAHAAW